MSEENVEMVRRIYEKWEDLVLADPDDKAFDEFFDTALEVDNSNAVFDGAVYRGQDGLREYLALLREAWSSLRLEPEEFIRVGEDQVMVAQRIFPRARAGVEVIARSATTYTFRDGKVIRIKNFQSKAEALEAARLRE
jgi:ketosteroid isomerase-like protein